MSHSEAAAYCCLMSSYVFYTSIACNDKERIAKHSRIKEYPLPIPLSNSNKINETSG